MKLKSYEQRQADKSVGVGLLEYLKYSEAETPYMPHSGPVCCVSTDAVAWSRARRAELEAYNQKQQELREIKAKENAKWLAQLKRQAEQAHAAKLAQQATDAKRWSEAVWTVDGLCNLAQAVFAKAEIFEEVDEVLAGEEQTWRDKVPPRCGLALWLCYEKQLSLSKAVRLLERVDGNGHCESKMAVALLRDKGLRYLRRSESVAKLKKLLLMELEHEMQQMRL